MNPYYKTDKCELYQCDNLDLMNSLPENYIDLIYCDILYNTGKKFKDYSDDLGTPQEAILWYEPRLIEMKRILKEEGSIYLHMDFRLVHYMKVEMDKIFGIKNFQNNIVWCYKSGGATKKRFNRKHDDILFYSKNKNFKYNFQLEKSYNRDFKPYHFKNVEEFQDKIGWYTMVGMKDYWEINMVGRTSHERNGYDTQKPKELVERIIKSSSNKGDIVADFFMGSGTTGEVSLELNRKFIGCDIELSACRVALNRIEKDKTDIL